MCFFKNTISNSDLCHVGLKNFYIFNIAGIHKRSSKRKELGNNGENYAGLQ